MTATSETTVYATIDMRPTDDRAVIRLSDTAGLDPAADAGLALYELGSKLGVDLIGCMIEVVNGETRTFADTEARP